MKEQIEALLAQCRADAQLGDAYGDLLQSMLARLSVDSPAADTLEAAQKLVDEIALSQAAWRQSADSAPIVSPAKEASLDALHAAAEVVRKPSPRPGGPGQPAPRLPTRQAGPPLAERQAQTMMDKLRPKFQQLSQVKPLVDASTYDALAVRMAEAEQAMNDGDFAKVINARLHMGAALDRDLEALWTTRRTQRYEDVYLGSKPGYDTLRGDASTLHKYALDEDLDEDREANLQLAQQLEDALDEMTGFAEAAQAAVDDAREPLFQRALESGARADAAGTKARNTKERMNQKLKLKEKARASAERRRSLEELLGGLRGGDAATMVRASDPRALQRQIALLVPGADDDDLAQDMTRARKSLLTAALGSPETCERMAKVPAAANALVLAAEGLSILTTEMLDGFGPEAPAMCRNLAIEIAKRRPKPKVVAGEGEGEGEGAVVNAAANPVLADWVWAKADPEDWNKRENGTSAQVFNSLWDARNYEQMVKLIGGGFDAGQAFNTEKDDGRGSREGIWSGFVQPLEHLLGNYVKRVHLAGLPLDTLDDADRAAIGEPSRALAARAEEVRLAGEEKAALEHRRDALPLGLKGSPQEQAERKELEARIATLRQVALTHVQKDELEKLGGLKTKVAGAKLLLQALEKTGDTSIATSYAAILESPLIQMMCEKDGFGTIWGFEDVRLPYVQAAREATPHGAKALRMWEMWKAIDLAINAEGYDRLLGDPDQAIPDYIAKGSEALDAEIAKNPEVYRGADVDAFKASFAEQAESYLRHLASRTPKGEFATAEQSGLAPTKLMGALGCKAGLWWAKEKGEKVYYCLDGVRIEQALDYKKQKNDGINKHLLLEGPLFLEVITFEEIREILKNWEKDLSTTVIFLRKGQVVDTADVLKWIETLKANDQNAGKRPAPLKQKIAAQLDELSPHLQGDAEVTDRLGLKIVIKANTLVRVAKMKAQGVLVPYLQDKCQPLFDFGVLPSGLTMLYEGMLQETDERNRAIQRKTLGRLIDLIVNPRLKAALKARMVG